MPFYIKILFIIVSTPFILFNSGAYTQTNVNTHNTSKDSILHSPKKALLYSAIIPGGGQTYNKQYWKIPIVYAALGTTFYFAKWNHKKHKIYKNAYIDYRAFLKYKHQSKDQDPPISLPESRSYEDLIIADVNDFTSTQEEWFQNVLLDRQSNYKRDRDLLYIVMAGIYILNIFDALVNAHLLYFDVSDELSLNIYPYFEIYEFTNEKYIGASLTLNF